MVGHTALCTGVSEVVRCILTPLGIKASFCPHTTVRHFLMRPMDHVTERELSGVVYQLPGAGCPATYVGLMGRCLNQQLSEHRWAAESGEAGSHLCSGGTRLGGTPPGGLGQGLGVGPPTPSPPEANPGVHPH